MFKIAVCDDEKVFRTFLVRLISDYISNLHFEYTVDEYSGGEEYLKSNWQETDILILDIEMKEMNGIEVKDYLQQRNSKSKIAFVTGHEENMPEAFGENVMGFILKPVSVEKLHHILRVACSKLRKAKLIEMEYNARPLVLNSDDVYYIQAEDKYSYINSGTNTFFSDKILKHWEDELRECDFVRVHRSYLVNLAKIKKITEKVILEDDTEITISRSKKQELNERYRLFLKYHRSMRNG